MRTNPEIDDRLEFLIASLAEETVQMVPDEKLAQRLVTYMLTDILNNWHTISKTWH